MTEPYIDKDPQETSEWLEALEAVLENEGPEKGYHLIQELINRARVRGIDAPYSANTPYLNSIPAANQDIIPGSQDLERRIASLIRWNAMAMVVKGNKHYPGIGGHIASYASSAVLYEVGFNHFFKGPDHPEGADMIFFQGHLAPGMYARAFLEGRLTEDHLNNFRVESQGRGLSSYPHPRLMPDFWQFPTVSMGLGPLQAIYQARFMKYMEHREMGQGGNRKVWAFLGDGETDEPEAQGALALATRENLDNLIFVINCNLQRLDGPVRGNGKIIQELEGNFRGAGWNVIKVIWGSGWDVMLERDKTGLLLKRMEEVVDGQYQTYASRGGAYFREHFFGKYPQLLELVKDKTDTDLEYLVLARGGHDPKKVYAAYAEAMKSQGKPTLILVKTVKGYGMGAGGQAVNATHSLKKLGMEALKHFRDRFNIPVADEDLDDIPFIYPGDKSPEILYLKERRQRLGGYLPARRKSTEKPLKTPKLELFAPLFKDSGERVFSTTMAFVRIINILTKQKEIKDRIVPIIPDEARTFGMEGMFRQLGIYNPLGQTYEPEDSKQVMFYRESKEGQMLQEGINEAGAMSSWLAAATAYSNYSVNMIPFYTFYSMFGFQRIGDLAWAAGDLMARGFLLGATAGRTTLNGEGLQHQDGHSHLQATTIPNCISYDPSFAYELAVIIQDGMYRMYNQQQNVFYYLTIQNENYHHPEMPKGVEEGILKGLYLFKDSGRKKLKVQLMGSGSILNESIAAAELLQKDWKVAADIWSAPSFNQLSREGIETDRWNTMHPEATQKKSWVETQLEGRKGPIIVSTDYQRAYPEQIRKYVPQQFHVLGTDGFGRSDTRENLRNFFEIDRYYITVQALKALADEGQIKPTTVTEAIKKYRLNPEKINPCLA